MHEFFLFFIGKLTLENGTFKWYKNMIWTYKFKNIFYFDKTILKPFIEN